MNKAIEKALQQAAEKLIMEFINGGNQEKINCEVNTTNNGYTQKRTSKIHWCDFSDEELRIVNEIEKKPGMKQIELISLMSINGSNSNEVTCEAGTVKFLLANLVKRKVLISSPTNGYRL